MTQWRAFRRFIRRRDFGGAMELARSLQDVSTVELRWLLEVLSLRPPHVTTPVVLNLANTLVARSIRDFSCACSVLSQLSKSADYVLWPQIENVLVRLHKLCPDAISAKDVDSVRISRHLACGEIEPAYAHFLALQPPLSYSLLETLPLLVEDLADRGACDEAVTVLELNPSSLKSYFENQFYSRTSFQALACVVLEKCCKHENHAAFVRTWKLVDKSALSLGLLYNCLLFVSTHDRLLIGDVLSLLRDGFGHADNNKTCLALVDAVARQGNVKDVLETLDLISRYYKGKSSLFNAAVYSIISQQPAEHLVDMMPPQTTSLAINAVLANHNALVLYPMIKHKFSWFEPDLETTETLVRAARTKRMPTLCHALLNSLWAKNVSGRVLNYGLDLYLSESHDAVLYLLQQMRTRGLQPSLRMHKRIYRAFELANDGRYKLMLNRRIHDVAFPTLSLADGEQELLEGWPGIA